MSKEGAGEYRAWNGIWGRLSGADRQLFTRGTPATCRQLSLRCYFEDLWAMLGERPAKCIELGSGRGTLSMYLAARGCDVTMLDLASEAFAVAAENFAKEGLPAPNLVAADAAATGLPDGAFDCVCSIGLLEHFDDPRPVLAETVRVLRPGGLAFHVVVPKIPERRMLVTNALFTPWKLPPRRLKDAANRLLGRNTRGGPEMKRTTLDTDDYRRMLAELRVGDATCIPYNPYHAAHENGPLERLLVTPVYRAHRALRHRVGAAPWTRTLEALAAAVLVAFRKPGA